MTENMKAFMDALKNNEELGKKFEKISGNAQDEGKDYTDELLALAKECGITLTQEDFDLGEGELSDEDLENVSGGSKFKDAARKIAEALTKSTKHKLFEQAPDGGPQAGEVDN